MRHRPADARPPQPPDRVSDDTIATPDGSQQRSPRAHPRGGQGRACSLTHHRSKPAVPIGGKYRLIDIPDQQCLHADLRRIFVLTQFNPASLNRHIAQTYRMDLFSQGFVEIPGGGTNAGQSALVPGHGRCCPPGGAALRHMTPILPDPRRRSPLPHGLQRDDRGPTSPAAPTSPSPRCPSPSTMRRRWASCASIAGTDRRIRGEAGP